MHFLVCVAGDGVSYGVDPAMLGDFCLAFKKPVTALYAASSMMPKLVEV